MEMQTQMNKWIKFDKLERDKKYKTSFWVVRVKATEESLGCIQWFNRWRKYAFFPNEDTVYENDCLMDIAKFINEQMKLRKK